MKCHGIKPRGIIMSLELIVVGIECRIRIKCQVLNVMVLSIVVFNVTNSFFGPYNRPRKRPPTRSKCKAPGLNNL